MSNCKWNTEKVKDFINSNNCEYIKGEYKNEKSIFTIRCACGDIFEKSFKAFKSGQMQCKKCGYKKGGKIISEKQILNGDYIKSEVNKTGCELLSPYINSESPMLIRCKCGEIFEKSWKDFKRGQQQCPKCGQNKGAKKREKKVKCKCDYCNEEIEIIQCRYNEFSHHFCNSECQAKWKSEQMKGNKINKGRLLTEDIKQKISNARKGKFKGVDNPHYNPNLTDEEREKSRNIQGYQDFINGVYKRDNYTCQICGDNKGGNLNAHHLNSYNWYKEGRTNINNGITLCDNKCHNEFHSIYGYGDNTKEQFIEFLTNKYKETQDQYFIDLIEKINNRLS